MQNFSNMILGEILSEMVGHLILALEKSSLIWYSPVIKESHFLKIEYVAIWSSISALLRC